MLYKIVNPSDPYTIEAYALDVAFVACLLLGDGQYAFDPLGTTDEARKLPSVPALIFGGGEEWCLLHLDKGFEQTVHDVLTDKRRELADCLDSCVIGSASARLDFLKAMQGMADPAEREKYREERQDRLRSSLNDIGTRAYKLAAKYRTGSPEPIEQAPRQMFGL